MRFAYRPRKVLTIIAVCFPILILFWVGLSLTIRLKLTGAAPVFYFGSYAFVGYLGVFSALVTVSALVRIPNRRLRLVVRFLTLATGIRCLTLVRDAPWLNAAVLLLGLVALDILWILVALYALFRPYWRLALGAAYYLIIAGVILAWGWMFYKVQDGYEASSALRAFGQFRSALASYRRWYDTYPPTLEAFQQFYGQVTFPYCYYVAPPPGAPPWTVIMYFHRHGSFADILYKNNWKGLAWVDPLGRPINPTTGQVVVGGQEAFPRP